MFGILIFKENLSQSLVSQFTLLNPYHGLYYDINWIILDHLSL